MRSLMQNDSVVFIFTSHLSQETQMAILVGLNKSRQNTEAPGKARAAKEATFIMFIMLD